MCGIIGFITEEKGAIGADARKRFVTAGLVIDTLRGFDSTGVYTLERGHFESRGGWAKSATNGAEFVGSKNYHNRVLSEINKLGVVLGHNRAATIGKVSTETAHPFVSNNDHVALIHNGTVRSTSRLPYPIAGLKGVTVDSHAICENLSRVGPGEKEKVTKEIVGGTALVWHDAREGMVHFARNSGRPIHFARAKHKGGTLFFASEARQLQFLMDYCRIEVESIYQLAPDTLLSFSDGSIEPTVSLLDMGSEHPTYTSGGYAGDWRGRAYSLDGISNRNRVYAGGRMRDIPKPCVESLAELGLRPEDRLKFMPQRSLPERGKRCRIFGELPSIGVSCSVDVFHEVTEQALTREWIIRPLALMETKSRAPVVVGHVESYAMGKRDKEVFDTGLKKSHGDLNPREDSVESSVRFDLFEGPGGIWLSWDEAEEAIEGGCRFCKKGLTMFDVDNLAWTRDGYPVCAVCSHHMPQAGGYKPEFDAGAL